MRVKARPLDPNDVPSDEELARFLGYYCDMCWLNRCRDWEGCLKRDDAGRLVCTGYKNYLYEAGGIR